MPLHPVRTTANTAAEHVADHNAYRSEFDAPTHTHSGTYTLTTPQQAAVLTARLQMANENATMLILGDSTGAGVTRWGYLLTQWLAARYPAYTVDYRAWNDGGQVYDSAVVIQTGTGAFTLTVYNGSVTGSVASYPLTTSARIALMAPAAPQLVIVNYGHNNVGVTAYRASHYALCRGIQERWPNAGLICCMQNPRATTDNGSGYAADRSNDLVRQRQVMELCASEGYGCVNVTQAFLNVSTYQTTLLDPDGLHPTDAGGSPLWAAEIEKHFDRALGVIPAAPITRPTWQWEPASKFITNESTPVYGLVNAGAITAPGFAMPATGTSSVNTAFDLPPHWTTYDLWVIWALALGSGLTGSTNQVRWSAAFQNLGSAGFTIPFAASDATTAISASPSDVTGTALNAGGTYPTSKTLVATGQTIANRPLGVRIRRLGDNANDNADVAYLYGILLVRAS